MPYIFKLKQNEILLDVKPTLTWYFEQNSVLASTVWQEAAGI